MTVGHVYRAMAVFLATLAAFGALFFFRMKWAPGVDFDMTGFFWLIENMGRLILIAVVLVCAAAAVSLWIRASRAEG